MSEWEEKLNTLLSDPDAMAQVMNMAQNLSQQMGQSGGSAPPPPPGLYIARPPFAEEQRLPQVDEARELCRALDLVLPLRLQKWAQRAQKRASGRKN